MRSQNAPDPLQAPQDTTTLYECYRCKERKPADDMRPNYSKGAGKKFTYCRLCQRIMNRATYTRDAKKRAEAAAIYRKSEAGLETNRRADRKSYRLHRDKHRARSRLRYAVEKGRITKQPCMTCGEVKVEAHHYLGYEEAYWYDVHWLCRYHHREAHGFVTIPREEA